MKDDEYIFTPHAIGALKEVTRDNTPVLQHLTKKLRVDAKSN